MVSVWHTVWHEAPARLRKKLLPRPFASWPYEPHSLRMASIYHFLLYFLRKFRFTKSSIHRCIKRWALFLAFLGRKFGINYLWYDEKRGKPRQAGPSLSRMGARLELGEVVVAASHIPASATHPSTSHPSLHDVAGATGQPHTNPSSRTSPPASIRAEPHPHRDHAHPTTTLGVGIYGNRSSANLSTHSRASDRLSILHQTHSRESLHASIGQAARFPRAPHRQFGRGPSPSPSRERSPSPPARVHQPSPTSRIAPLPRLELDTTNLHHPTHVEIRVSPINPPSAVSHAHEPLSPPSLHGHRRRQSSTSVVVGIVTPSTESLPLSPLPNQQPLSEEPYTIGSPNEGPTVADAPDARAGTPLQSPIASSPSATSDLELPDGRVLQLINSEQVPRYTKEDTVQVDDIITSIKPLSLFAGPTKEHTMKFHLGQRPLFSTYDTYMVIDI
jgi:hypothetical protein